MQLLQPFLESVIGSPGILRTTRIVVDAVDNGQKPHCQYSSSCGCRRSTVCACRRSTVCALHKTAKKNITMFGFGAPPLDPRDGKPGGMTARSSVSEKERKRRMAEPSPEAAKPREDLLSRKGRATYSTVMEVSDTGHNTCKRTHKHCLSRASTLLARSFRVPLSLARSLSCT